MRGPAASVLFGAMLTACISFLHTAAWATPLDFIAVGDPLEDEIRVLEVSGVPVRLPHLGMRPLQVLDLPALDQTLPGVAEIARQRLLRSIARDRGILAVPGATPRLLEIQEPEDERLEFSAGIDGRGTVARGRRPILESGSGVRLRFAAQVGRWLAFTDIDAAHVEGADRYAERILNNDAALLTDQSSISYTGERGRWGVSLGRGRWSWGPGDEGSLVLSKTSPSYSALAFHLRIEALRADGMILNATLRDPSGMQMAAHRLEWQPMDGLRVGYTEAVRYRASTWSPLYLAGVIPFSMVQNLLSKDEPDSLAANRNNVIAAGDVAWRVAPGTRFYSEILIDDLRTDNAHIVSKYAYQLGWEGVGTVRGTRVTWDTELTRLTRFVYTSFNDRSFVIAGEPLGFPTGPDSRRLRVRAAWDPRVDVQLDAIATRTDRGESGLDSVYVPGSPRVDVASFAGVVESTRHFEVGFRYWPASGIDVRLAAGSDWVRNVDHVEGADRTEPFATLGVRLTR